MFLINILKNPIFVTFTNEREYPPATARTFTQNATLISGQSYGNGLYILSASSQYSSTTIDYGPYKMFGSTGEWTTETAMYAPSTGNYGGTFSFNGYNGEWIKIQLPVKIKLTKYSESTAVEENQFSTLTDNLITGIEEVFGAEIQDTYEKTTKPDQFQTVSTSYRDGIRQFQSKDLKITVYNIL